MSAYTASVVWSRGDAVFTDNKYARAYTVAFDGGVSIAGSASPANVPAPYSRADAADPEELLVASVSACHMLWFIDYARRGGFVLDSYDDAAEGVMGKDDRGKVAFTAITLRPKCAWSGAQIPDAATLDELHHKAHEACFIANSLRCDVKVEARR